MLPLTITGSENRNKGKASNYSPTAQPPAQPWKEETVQVDVTEGCWAWRRRDRWVASNSARGLANMRSSQCIKALTSKSLLQLCQGGQDAAVRTAKESPV